jgi:hypothetical protein
MRYKLLRDILEFKVGTIIYVTYAAIPCDPPWLSAGFAQLGHPDWGWKIPLFIIKRNPEWFEEIE